jgi:biopolymer transport protein ExbD
MAGTLGGKGKRGPIVGINVTPMVDVVLVLLIIMMVSATYIVAQSLKVELPKAQTSEAAQGVVATVTVEKSGRLLFNDKPVDDGGLSAALREAQKSGEVSLVVSADKDTAHGRVVHTIDVAKLAGITKFAIHVEPTK